VIRIKITQKKKNTMKSFNTSHWLQEVSVQLPSAGTPARLLLFALSISSLSKHSSDILLNLTNDLSVTSHGRT